MMEHYTQPQVARQPILDVSNTVEAYELLFRSGTDGAAATYHPEASTTGVVSTSLFGIGVDRLTSGKLGFVNFGRKLLVGGFAELLSPQAIGIELLPSVSPDDEVTAACARLRDYGFTIAVDDVLPDDPRLALHRFVDVAKLDFLDTTPGQRLQAAAQWRERGARLLGKRIETNHQREEAVELGCALFQGYFFAEPIIVPGRELTGNRLAHLRILQLVMRPDISIAKMEQAVKSDVALSYKLLKYINSAVFGWKHRIESVHQALVLLGEREIRKWVALVSLTSMGSDRPLELAVNSVVRGRMCESLAAPLGAPHRGADLFFTGMLSHVDALVSQPMEEALVDVYVADDVREALLGGDADTPPATALALARSYEAVDWESLSRVCSAHDLDEDTVGAAYRDAVEFGGALLGR